MKRIFIILCLSTLLLKCEEVKECGYTWESQEDCAEKNDLVVVPDSHCEHMDWEKGKNKKCCRQKNCKITN